MSGLMINGVLPPMVTPFTEGGEVDYAKHIRNLERWNQRTLAGYLVLGSNGEAVYLSEEEKTRLIACTVGHAADDRLVLAGTGMESARETLRLTNKAAELGAAAALVLTPFYYLDHMTDGALIGYYSFVADRADIPVLLYNVPKFTHRNVSREVVQELCHHPNIVGMKDSSGDVTQLASFRKVVPKDWNLVVGTAAAWLPALALGVRGGILALANCLPDECAQIQEAFSVENHSRAESIYRRVLPVNTAVTATYGIAGLKHALDLLGYEGGAVRNPLLPLTQEDRRAIEAILRKAGVLP
jgi:4-hydroxy-2-oxoglutarate aldolase